MVGMVGGLDTKVSSDPAVQRAYAADPFVPRKVPARLGNTVLTLTERCQSVLEDVELPLLVMHGTSDELTDPQGSQQLYDRSRSRDKTLRLYDGWYHELFNEPQQDEVLAEVVDWITARLGSPRP
jgi:alpha-beta hydrolase superfamily lysophospholipase